MTIYGVTTDRASATSGMQQHNPVLKTAREDKFSTSSLTSLSSAIQNGGDDTDNSYWSSFKSCVAYPFVKIGECLSYIWACICCKTDETHTPEGAKATKGLADMQALLEGKASTDVKFEDVNAVFTSLSAKDQERLKLGTWQAAGCPKLSDRSHDWSREFFLNKDFLDKSNPAYLGDTLRKGLSFVQAQDRLVAFKSGIASAKDFESIKGAYETLKKEGDTDASKAAAREADGSLRNMCAILTGQPVSDDLNAMARGNVKVVQAAADMLIANEMFELPLNKDELQALVSFQADLVTHDAKHAVKMLNGNKAATALVEGIVGFGVADARGKGQAYLAGTPDQAELARVIAPVATKATELLAKAT